MVAEVLRFLVGDVAPATVVDMTVGAGGHTRALLEAGVVNDAKPTSLPAL